MKLEIFMKFIFVLNFFKKKSISKIFDLEKRGEGILIGLDLLFRLSTILSGATP